MNTKSNLNLERQLSPVNVWALALGCIIGSGAFLMPGTTFLPAAGPAGTAIAFGLASVAMVIISFNYHFMISHYPVAGGEFTYANQTFGTNHAYICSWFLCLGYLAIVPVNATGLAMVSRNIFGDFFQFGFHYTVAGYDVYFGEIALAAAALLLFAWLSIRGVKFAGIFQTGLVVALIGGVAVVAVAAIINPNITLDNLEPGFNPDNSPMAGILAVVAVAPFAFVGFDTVPQAAEEFKFPHRKARLIMIISILFGGAMYIIINTVAAAAIPEGFTSWTEYINNLDSQSGLAALPTFYAAHKLLGMPGLVFIVIAVMAAILSGIVGFYMATSRLFFSMSRDRVLPSWFGKLHPKYKTPANAIVFIFIISVIIPFFGRTAFGWVVDMSAIGAAIGYGYTSAATLKYAIKESKMSAIVTGVIGVIIAAFCLILLLVPIPVFNCHLGNEAYICLIIWIILGVLFFIWSKRKKNKKLA